MSSDEHVPVLLDPVLEGLRVLENGVYVDGTFGRGGHSNAILRNLGDGGRLIAIDRDPAAIAAAPKALIDDPRFELIRGQCAELEEYMGERELLGNVDGLLLDLGVSSPQLDEAGRGFSFLRDGPLDMRLDNEQGQTAAEWLAEVDEATLTRTLYKFGDEKLAKRIARAVVSRREITPISTTGELARIVQDAVPAKLRSRKRHPATKTFQAIRIEINDELGQLKAVLEQSLRVLKKGGRLCVISFHSLEDRIVKRFMRDHSREPEQYRGMPNIPEEFLPPFRSIGKAITASDAEIAANIRSRSARLRVAERCT
jgi:16S rRNA (cytosine1402-N4)-methyltransferase